MKLETVGDKYRCNVCCNEVVVTEAGGAWSAAVRMWRRSRASLRPEASPKPRLSISRSCCASWGGGLTQYNFNASGTNSDGATSSAPTSGARQLGRRSSSMSRSTPTSTPASKAPEVRRMW